MALNDQPEAAFVAIGHVDQPVALLALAVGVIVILACLLLTAGNLTITEAWVNGK